MAGIVVSNFGRATVATPPTGTGGLSFSVAAGKGALFPSPGAGEYFYGVFTNAAKSVYECVKVTVRSTDAFTIDPAGRGIDGTAPQTWLAGDIFYAPWTKAMLDEVPFSVALKALAALSATIAADKLAYFTSASAAALTGFTATARSILTLVFGAKGDLISGSAANAGVVTPIGADGTVLVARASAPGGFAWEVSGFTTGDAKLTFKTAADAGWVMANDGSIGSAASGATTRANADTAALYALLWTNVSNTWAPVATGRGANAAADFAANKAMTLPKALGRALAVSGAGSGLTARAIGEILGTETHTLTQAESPMKSHGHTVNDPPHGHPGSTVDENTDGGANIGGGIAMQSNSATVFASQGLNIAPSASGVTVNATGDASATPHNNMSPYAFWNAMIRL